MNVRHPATQAPANQSSTRFNRLRVLYWTVTLFLSLMLLMGGITEFIQHESGKEIMRHLGYPVHVLTLLGLGKILAAVTLIQTRIHVVKEWAYAGITFNLVGAFAARANAGDSAALILSPLIFLVVVFVSYALWKRIEPVPGTVGSAA